MLYCKPISWGRCWLMFLTTETAVAPGTSRTCSSLAPNGISQSTTPRTPFFCLASNARVEGPGRLHDDTMVELVELGKSIRIRATPRTRKLPLKNLQDDDVDNLKLHLGMGTGRG